MKTLSAVSCRYSLGLALLLPVSAVFALDEVKAAQPLACVSGGIGLGEREALSARQDQYSFWLTTAARQSGAYLSGVRVEVRDFHSGAAVLNCVLDGPWLFLALPDGQYEIVATYRENGTLPAQTLKKSTTIRKQEHRRMMLYFETSEPAQRATDK